MSWQDLTLMVFTSIVLFMLFVGGCDRTRLSFLEENSRDLRLRIQKLEAEMLLHNACLKKAEVRQ